MWHDTATSEVCWEPASRTSVRWGRWDSWKAEDRRASCTTKTKQLRVSVHGGDVRVLGSMPGLKWFAAGLGQRWTVPERNPGATRNRGTSQSIDFLDQRRCHGEPDPRHVDLVTEGLGVTQKVTTPLTKECLEDAEMDDALSSEEETKLYQSFTVRIGYI